MKYLVMIQGSQADYEAMRGQASGNSPAWSEKEIQAMFAFMGEVNNDLSESGEFVDGHGLAEPAQTRFVSLGEDGRPVVSDGPYSETKELLASTTGCSTARAWSGSPRSPRGSRPAPGPRGRPSTRW